MTCGFSWVIRSIPLCCVYLRHSSRFRVALDSRWNGPSVLRRRHGVRIVCDIHLQQKQGLGTHFFPLQTAEGPRPLFLPVDLGGLVNQGSSAIPASTPTPTPTVRRTELLLQNQLLPPEWVPALEGISISRHRDGTTRTVLISILGCVQVG